LLYIGEDKLEEHDLPHCTKATIMILEEYKKKHMEIVYNIQNSKGQVSTTMDMWSNPNHDSYMAVTAHVMM
ncbi:hypothetical protein SCLCIDRAFT_121117, partial [Scleroderma citrinum Foug A]